MINGKWTNKNSMKRNIKHLTVVQGIVECVEVNFVFYQYLANGWLVVFYRNVQTCLLLRRQVIDASSN